jgi:Protein of unknown function (DUF1552)
MKNMRNTPRLPLGRRSFLAGAGAATLLAPFAHHFAGRGASRARAQDDLPKRLLVVFSPNGTAWEEWTPDGGETDFRLKRILAPLERHRDKLLILSGLDMLSTDAGPGDGHQKGMGHVLTGVELLSGDTMGGCDSCPPVSWSSGASIDQAVAQHISRSVTTPFPSLELGCRVSDSENVWTRMSYTAASAPLPPENDPARAFASVFGDPTLDPGEVRRRLALRQSVLDHNLGDFARTRRVLSGADRERFDRHMATVRDIELRLGSTGTVGAACMRPDVPSTIDFRANDVYPEVVRLQSEIMAMTFACDLTRVGSIMWTNSVGNIPFPWLGFSDLHHDLSHEGDSNGDAIGKIIAINEWYSQQFAYLLDQLDAIPEGDGESVLDHTLVVWVNELGRGNSHSLRNIPFVLAGNVPGAMGAPDFRMGRHVRFDGERTHNDLWTTVAQSFGLDVDRWGDLRYSNGPLAGLRV